MSAVDFAAVKAVQLSAVVGQSVTLKRRGQEWIGSCPFHQERSPSFSVNDAKAIAHCFGCGWHGDAADFVAELTGCSLRAAAEQLGAGQLPTLNRIAPAYSDKCQTADAALRIWREAVPLGGTPADAYFRSRAITCQLPETLRFARLRHPDGGTHPCLVALVTSPDNKFSGIQRTYLRAGGRKADVSTVKLSLGRIAGAAIRLAPVAAELIVTGGIEDGLSARQMFGKAVWVAAGEGNMGKMILPPEVQSVIIGSDNDESGKLHASRAAQAFAEQGREVRILRPYARFKDLNEELMGESE